MIDPLDMTFTEWSDQMMLDLERYGDVAYPESEDKWREWAESLLVVPGVSMFCIPDSRYFDSWRPWAQRLVEILR